MNINHLTAYRIRKIRMEKRLKIQYVAKLVGVSIGSYSQLENGKVEFKLTKLQKIAEVLEVPINSLLPIDFKTDFEMSYLEKQLALKNQNISITTLLGDSIRLLSKAKELHDALVQKSNLDRDY